MEAIEAWFSDYATSMGAALSYYTLFSLTPLLLISISVAGMVFGEDAARGQIFYELRTLIGPQGAAAVQGLLENVNHPAQGVAATILGVVLLAIGATAVFGELQNALDRIWRAPVRDRRISLLTLLRSRLLSFGMVLAIGFLLIVSLVLSATVAALGRWWGPAVAGWEFVAQALNLVLSFVLTTVVVAAIYKFMPRVRIHWRDVWIGALATALLLSIGKALIGIYIGKSAVASGFGAAGSIVILLIWVYYSAQLFLLGAEFTWVYAHQVGSLKHERSSAPPGESDPS
jgi:membrane protein